MTTNTSGAVVVYDPDRARREARSSRQLSEYRPSELPLVL